jgi:hypothetical protein
MNEQSEHKSINLDALLNRWATLPKIGGVPHPTPGCSWNGSRKQTRSVKYDRRNEMSLSPPGTRWRRRHRWSTIQFSALYEQPLLHSFSDLCEKRRVEPKVNKQNSPTFVE